jgi:uncharacterized protein (TIGR02301 family)
MGRHQHQRVMYHSALARALVLARVFACLLVVMPAFSPMPVQAQWFDWLFRPRQPAPAPEPAPRAPRQRPANPAQPRPNTPASKPVIQQLTPAQERPLLQFSETIGSLAFLAELCQPSQGNNPWSQRMETLLTSDGDGFGLRERMIGAYNQGYGAFSTTYRQCTGMAEAARRVLTRDLLEQTRDVERVLAN